MNDDQRHLMIEAISDWVHSEVDQMTKNLSPEDDEEIRQRLTETFRFWRRE